MSEVVVKEVEDVVEQQGQAAEPGQEAREERSVMSGEEVAAARELVLRAHPDTVPELVRGESVAALMASVEPARAAYQRIAAAVGPAAPAVPAGDAPPLPVDVEALPATEKIRRGLAGRA